MTSVKKGLVGKGYAGQCRYDGLVPNPNGYTVQYTVAVENRTVYNRFYITPLLMFYVEAACNDPKDQDVHEFYELFSAVVVAYAVLEKGSCHTNSVIAFLPCSSAR